MAPHNHMCDACNRSNFGGTLFKCLTCTDYCLCERCYTRGVASKNHKLEHLMQSVTKRKIYESRDSEGDSEDELRYECGDCRDFGFRTFDHGKRICIWHDCCDDARRRVCIRNTQFHDQEQVEQCQVCEVPQPVKKHQMIETLKDFESLKIDDIKDKKTLKSSIDKLSIKLDEYDLKIKDMNAERADIAAEKALAEKKLISLEKTGPKSKNSNTNRENAQESETNCKICFEPFDQNEHHRSCITKCFHTFCFSCLNSLKKKKCPNCRECFRTDDIRKLF